MHGARLLAVGTELCEFTCGGGGCAPGGGSPPPSLPGGGVLWALCPAGPRGRHVVRTGTQACFPSGVTRLSRRTHPVVSGPARRHHAQAAGGLRPAQPRLPPAAPGRQVGGPARAPPTPVAGPGSLLPTARAPWLLRPTPNRQVWRRHRHFWSAGGSAQGPTGSRRPVAPSPWHTGARRPRRWWLRWVLGKRPPLCWMQPSGSQRAGAGSSCQQKVEMEPPDPLQGGVRRPSAERGGARVTQHVGGPPP